MHVHVQIVDNHACLWARYTQVKKHVHNTHMHRCVLEGRCWPWCLQALLHVTTISEAGPMQNGCTMHWWPSNWPAVKHAPCTGDHPTGLLSSMHDAVNCKSACEPLLNVLTNKLFDVEASLLFT